MTDRASVIETTHGEAMHAPLQWLNTEQRAVSSLAQLRDLLGLPGLPTRIECFDISYTQGTNSVGAMVVFEQGEPKKSRYRKFKIKTVEGANDVASIQEVLRRRFKRAAEASGEEVSAGVQDPRRNPEGEVLSSEFRVMS